MSLLGVGAIIESVGKVAGDLITTEKERRQLDLEEKKIDQATDLAQIEVNKVEAASSSVFVAGWRPAIGWIGAAALAYQLVFMQTSCQSAKGRNPEIVGHHEGHE